MKFAYVHRYDTENPGDLFSSPMHYLGNTCSGVVVDVFSNDIPEMSVDVTIVGGGALMTNKKFVRKLDHKLDKIHSKITVAWGVGYEPENIDASIQEQFDLFGTREYKVNSKMQWVPCASAMHDVFRKTESIVPTNDFLVVDHFKRSIEFENTHTRMINKPNGIRNMVEQIANHRFVITSSYHVAYWSILMGKKCAVIGDNLPTKFNRMKHFPVKAKSWHSDLYDQAKTWPNARYESIKANHGFYRQLEEKMGVENPLQLLSMQHQHSKRDTV